eukprot:SAG11_NODE_266_length_11468_cov_11.519222_9_plen_214_part_00
MTHGNCKPEHTPCFFGDGLLSLHLLRFHLLGLRRHRHRRRCRRRRRTLLIPHHLHLSLLPRLLPPSLATALVVLNLRSRPHLRRRRHRRIWHVFAPPPSPTMLVAPRATAAPSCCWAALTLALATPSPRPSHLSLAHATPSPSSPSFALALTLAPSIATAAAAALLPGARANLALLLPLRAVQLLSPAPSVGRVVAGVALAFTLPGIRQPLKS